MEEMELVLELDTPNEQGSKKRDHEKQTLDQLKQMPKLSADQEERIEELEKRQQAGQEVPACIQHVWEWFWKLHSQSRTSSESGPNPITYTEIRNWIELTGERVLPYEIDIIKKLDQTYLSFSHQKRREKMQQNKNKKGK